MWKWLDSFKLAYWTKILFNLASNATMLSILTFYYRLIGDTSVTWFRSAIHAAMVFNLAVWFVFFIALILTCVYVYHKFMALFLILYYV